MDPIADSLHSIFRHYDLEEVVEALLINDTEKLEKMRKTRQFLEDHKERFLEDMDGRSSSDRVNTLATVIVPKKPE